MNPSKQFDFGQPADDHHLSSEFVELDSSDIRVYQGHIAETEIRHMLEKDQQKASLGDFGDLDNNCFDLVDSPHFQDTLKGKDFQSMEYENRSPVASFGIVKEITSRSRKLIGNKIHIQRCNSEVPEANDKKMSTNARIQLAGQRFIDFYSSKTDEISQWSHPYPVSFSGLSDDEANDIELLFTLLTSADKIGQGQFDHASKLVELCHKTSSNEGNPVERLVYYFSEAMHAKINREIGRVAQNGLERMQKFDLHEALMNIDMSIIAFHQKVPLSQVCQFTAVHMMIENVKEARNIHVVDLEIRTGMQYTVMMQALASHSDTHIEHFKITAIGTRSESKIKDTCKNLADFAKSVNIPFSFKIVMVADVLNFNINLLELNDDEKVAVYAPFMLSFLIVRPNRLEYLMREIWKLNPCIIVITEVEANHTSPVFVNRFTEALFFYGALFDSLSDCLADDDLNRKAIESVFYSQAIHNIVAAEGDERKIRHVGIDVWRAFFKRFGMLEVELTAASFNEAKLLISNFDCRSSCTLVIDGKSFVVGWKDIPIFSVSAWKFA